MRFPIPLDRPLSDSMRRMAIQMICNTFSQAFDMKAPDVARLPAESALRTFRDFSATCMEETLASPADAAARREELERRARRLGSRVRMVLHPSDAELPRLLHALYAAIGIDVIAEVPGMFTFNRCIFAKRYTPALCAFMSAFDSGFVSGLCDAGDLRFDTRITQGAPCCRAHLAPALVPQALPGAPAGSAPKTALDVPPAAPEKAIPDASSEKTAPADAQAGPLPGGARDPQASPLPEDARSAQTGPRPEGARGAQAGPLPEGARDPQTGPPGGAQNAQTDSLPETAPNAGMGILGKEDAR